MPNPDKEQDVEARTSETREILRRQNGDLRRQLTEHLMQNSALEESALRLSNTVEALQKQLKDAGQAVLEYRHRYSQLRSEAEQQKHNLSELANENNQLKVYVREQNETQSGELKSLSQRLKRFKRYRDRVRRVALPYVERLKGRVRETEAVLLQRDARIRDLETTAGALDQERQRLSSQLATYRTWYEEEIGKLRGHFGEQTKSDVGTIERLQTQLRSYSADRLRADAKIAELQETLSVLTEQLKASRASEETLRTEAVEAYRKLRSLSTHAQSSTDVARRSDEEIRQLRTLSESQYADLTAVRTINEELRESNGRLGRYRRRLKNAATALRNRYESMREEVSMLREARDIQAAEVRALRERSVALERKIGENDQAHRENSERQTLYYEQRVNALKADLKKAIGQLEEIRSGAGSWQDEINRLRPEVEVQKERAMKAERERDALQIRFAEELDRYSQIVMKLRTRSFSRGTEVGKTKSDLAAAEKRIAELERENKKLHGEVDGISALWEQSLEKR